MQAFSGHWKYQVGGEFGESAEVSKLIVKMVLICSSVVLRFFQKLRDAMDERERCVSMDCSARRERKECAQCSRPSAGQDSDLLCEGELSELGELDFTSLFAGEHTQPHHS